MPALKKDTRSSRHTKLYDEALSKMKASEANKLQKLTELNKLKMQTSNLNNIGKTVRKQINDLELNLRQHNRDINAFNGYKEKLDKFEDEINKGEYDAVPTRKQLLIDAYNATYDKNSLYDDYSKRLQAMEEIRDRGKQQFDEDMLRYTKNKTDSDYHGDEPNFNSKWDDIKGGKSRKMKSRRRKSLRKKNKKTRRR